MNSAVMSQEPLETDAAANGYINKSSHFHRLIMLTMRPQYLFCFFFFNFDKLQMRQEDMENDPEAAGNKPASPKRATFQNSNTFLEVSPSKE